MLTLLSPAKKLLQVTKPYSGQVSTPVLAKKTAELVELMKASTSQDLAALMHLSPTLAKLNYQRYQEFCSDNPQAWPAVFLFQGDVYQSLKAASWEKETLEFSQEHLLILSGLYGLLKPLDLIQPYRLEMGTMLANSCGKNLYSFWQNIITLELQNRLALQTRPVLVNLASAEYFKVVDADSLEFPIVTINFMEEKQGQRKMIGIHAKKARGAMASFIMQNRMDNLSDLQQFDLLDYHYSKKDSDKQHFVFVRSHS